MLITSAHPILYTTKLPQSQVLPLPQHSLLLPMSGQGLSKQILAWRFWKKANVSSQNPSLLCRHTFCIFETLCPSQPVETNTNDRAREGLHLMRKNNQIYNSCCSYIIVYFYFLILGCSISPIILISISILELLSCVFKIAILQKEKKRLQSLSFYWATDIPVLLALWYSLLQLNPYISTHSHSTLYTTFPTTFSSPYIAIWTALSLKKSINFIFPSATISRSNEARRVSYWKQPVRHWGSRALHSLQWALLF